MYLCAGAAFVGLIGYLLCIRKGRRETYGIYFLVLLCSGVFGVLLCLSENDADSRQTGEIRRPQPGAGAMEQEYLLSVEDLSISEPYRVTVENRHLTKRELEELFGQATEELERTFLGENGSLDRITHDVVLTESLLDGRVEVGWSFDDYEAVNLSGELQEEALCEAGTQVQVIATLQYEDVQAEHRFSMMVYPPEQTIQEQFYAMLAQELKAQNDGNGSVLRLPDELSGHALVWTKKEKTTPYLVLLLGLCAMAGIAVGKKEDLRKAKEKREAQLLAEYPQMLSQMALLLGAGMTVSHAWERIVQGYENKCAQQTREMQRLPVYEEMRITYHQIKDGLGERSAYEQFGERLQLQVYRRFATLLVQNLRKGTAGLSKLLEKEMQTAFEEQAGFIKKRGEELQTKLLLPMLLLLTLVIVMIMIPAVASFRV